MQKEEIMNLIFFDSNFLFYSKERFTNDIIKKIKNSNFEIFTSELVILEGKNKNIREITELYKKYKTFMSDEKLRKYVDLNEHAEFDENKVLEKSNLNIDMYVSNFFGNNIIKSVDNAQIGSVLLSRYQLKQPPFINAENSSDKGWKDTLIWVSFMEYCIGKNYDCFYFVSKDNGFINQQEILKEEFANKVGKPIIFINDDSFENLFLSLGITKKENKNDKQIPDDLVGKIIAAIDEFTESEEVYNAFGDTRQINAFSFNKKPSLDEIEKFCNLLKEFEPSFVFMKTIDLSEIVSKSFSSASINTEFNLKTIRKFLDAWNIVRNDYPIYKTYFLKAVEEKFANSVRDSNPLSDISDLPF